MTDHEMGQGWSNLKLHLHNNKIHSLLWLSRLITILSACFFWLGVNSHWVSLYHLVSSLHTSKVKSSVRTQDFHSFITHFLGSLLQWDYLYLSSLPKTPNYSAKQRIPFSNPARGCSPLPYLLNHIS